METLKIFDAKDLSETVPNDFNAIKIKLEGGPKSDLDWGIAKDTAQKWVDQGLKIFWELDLGLGGGLSYPLSHVSQFLTLKLAIEHFCVEIWETFHKSTVGIALYRGEIDFAPTFQWNEEQLRLFENWKKENISIQNVKEDLLARLYCRDAIEEYIELLGGHLPENLPVYLLLNISTINSFPEIAYLLKGSRFFDLQRAVRGENLPSKEFAWEKGRSYIGFIGRDLSNWEKIAAPICGVCISTIYSDLSALRLQEIFYALNQHHVNYRMVSEELLSRQWEGLDYLVVSSEIVTSQGYRQLKGFCAAGGTVLRLGSVLGLPQEIPFKFDVLPRFYSDLQVDS
jgi:hypothetical protein